ncbi:hypothetical protein [Streptomyces flavidovirens]|uniref:hypothetical protein n=1 Tax=Streptomyces flavidovirens TaxID=67298 RepID=UPI0036BE52D8
MPPTPPPPGAPRPAAVVNAEIRERAASLSAEEYQALLEEWAEAVKASVVEAA